MIRRHSATAIFMHWYNAACWLLLLFTGFALLANPLMQPVGDVVAVPCGPGRSARWGCSGCTSSWAWRGSSCTAAYLLVRARAEALPFLKEITDLHIGSDLVWCLRKGLWLVLGERLMRRLGLDPELPPQGFYNAGQKLAGDHRRSVQPWACALTGLILAALALHLGSAGDGGRCLQICPARRICCCAGRDGCFPARAHLHGGLRTRRGPGAAVHVHRIRAAGAHQAPQPAVVPQAGGTGKGIGPVSFETAGRHRGRGTLLETTLFPPQTRQCGVHSSLFKGVCVD